MPKFNTLWTVVEEIDAPDEEAALNTLRGKLDAAGFTAYDGTPDLVPDGYALAYLSENQDGESPSTAEWFAESKHLGCTGTGYAAEHDTIEHRDPGPCPVHPGL